MEPMEVHGGDEEGEGEGDDEDDDDDDDDDDDSDDFGRAVSNRVTSLLMIRRDSSSHTISPSSLASRRKITRNERNLFDGVDWRIGVRQWRAVDSKSDWCEEVMTSGRVFIVSD